MQANDRGAFARLVSEIHAYYRQDVSAFVLDVWWDGCQGYDLEQVSRAFTVHAKDPDKGQFLPKLADLERILRGTTTDRAAIAWGKVREAMASVGQYQDVAFDELAIHAAVADLGGWPKVCRTEHAELGYLQHRFCESYRAYAKRSGYECPRTLIGDRSPDVEWEKRGLRPPRPVLRGNLTKALAIAEGKTAQLEHQP